MREQSEKHAAMPWHVSVAVKDVDETGKRFDLAADTAARAAVARIAGLRDLPRLEANFEVTRYGAEGLRVTGRVSATVGQACVVTLEPLVNEIAEDVDLIFVPRPAAAVAEREDGETEAPQKSWDSAEPLVDGAIDLGAIATEFLILGLDPYPRKAGAVFQPPQAATPDGGPFAALASLKKAPQ